jgi:hypothetical protein
MSSASANPDRDWSPQLTNSAPVGWRPGRDLYVSMLVVYEVNNLLAGVDMTKRVAGMWMHEKMD